MGRRLPNRPTQERVGEMVYLEIDSARACRETIDLRAAHVRQCQQQVRGWRILRDDVTVAFKAAIAAAHHHRGWILPVVRVAVAHAAAPVQYRVIQQRPIALFRRLQLVEEVRELHDLVRGDLGVLRELLRIVAMMQDGVVLPARG